MKYTKRTSKTKSLKCVNSCYPSDSQTASSVLDRGVVVLRLSYVDVDDALRTSLAKVRRLLPPKISTTRLLMLRKE